ncbi:hypothetical protein PF007_g29040 [Phytophthora fragariae]|uniref:Uncharacterized protein n=1 Tax=Phytophthora fragariae TaxID=53985 RepID=A0A6A3PY25_9STRA|nr:hypothetical protein PF007_g29040 [Phytophthora fragariae]
MRVNCSLTQYESLFCNVTVTILNRIPSELGKHVLGKRFKRLKQHVKIKACGYRHTALITADRHLCTFSHGDCGRLGHDNQEDYTSPVPMGYFASLMEGKDVSVGGGVDVSCSREHIMAMTASGDLVGVAGAKLVVLDLARLAAVCTRLK